MKLQEVILRNYRGFRISLQYIIAAREYDLKRGAKNEKTGLYPAGSTPAPYSACRLRRLGLRKARGSRV